MVTPLITHVGIIHGSHRRSILSTCVVIHFAARFKAPLIAPLLLSTRYPESLLSKDITGRCPIHLSCMWSAASVVIEYLIMINPYAVSIPDSLRKTPLHYNGGIIPLAQK